jgi:hypothetical protein
MRSVTFLWIACLAAAGISLALGYAWGGLWELGLLWAALAFAWGALQRRRGWIQHAGFAVCLAAAGAGFPLGAPPPMLLAATVAGLSAWDLGHFRARLSGSVGIENGLIRRHLAALLVVVLLGLLVGGSALVVEINLSFVLATGAALALFYSLGRALFNLKIEG